MAMTQVIDASIAVSFFVDDRFSHHVRSDIFGIQPSVGYLAPTLILFELHGVLAKRFAAGRVALPQFLEAPRILGEFVTFLQVDPNTAQEAIKLSMLAIQLTAETGDARPLPGNVYDCAYIAVAFAHNAELVTADQRQAAIALDVGCKVCLIVG
jgi:PIN domain